MQHIRKPKKHDLLPKHEGSAAQNKISYNLEANY